MGGGGGGRVAHHRRPVNLKKIYLEINGHNVHTVVVLGQTIS